MYTCHWYVDWFLLVVLVFNLFLGILCHKVKCDCSKSAHTPLKNSVCVKAFWLLSHFTLWHRILSQPGTHHFSIYLKFMCIMLVRNTPARCCIVLCDTSGPRWMSWCKCIYTGLWIAETSFTLTAVPRGMDVLYLGRSVLSFIILFL